MTRTCAVAWILGVALACGPRLTHAAQSYDNCGSFITSLPAVITTQGTWCLKQDLATAITSGNAITINTNNVTIDCNDFKLGGLSAGLATTANGIYASNRTNATVRHCNIRGFAYGVNFDGASSAGHLIEDNRFDGNTAVGIRVSGDGSTLQRNRIFDTGGSTAFADADGIIAVDAVDVLNNTVSGLTATEGGNGHAYGIQTQNDAGSSINGNRVRGLLADGTGVAIGIRNSAAGRVTMRGNELLGSAAVGSIGMDCFDADNSAKHNHIDAFATAFSVCSDDGDNIVRP
jgi:hypothetical protein